MAKLSKQALENVNTVFVMDGSFSQSGKHVLRLGNRGVLSFRLSTEVADHDLHSGNFGNVSRNAAVELLNTLNKLIDPNSYRVRIPGFYEHVDAPSELEQQWIEDLPFPKNVPSPLFKDKSDYYRRLMFMPSLTVNGLKSGYQGDYVKTIIPCKASAVIDCRLVVGQKCNDIEEKIRHALSEELNSGKVKIQFLVRLDPTKIDAHLPLINRVKEAIKKGD